MLLFLKNNNIMRQFILKYVRSRRAISCFTIYSRRITFPEVKMKAYSITGTLIWYYYICQREVWLMSRQINSLQDNPFL